MILGISSSLIAGLAETYYISSLGSIPLAALGFTFPVTAALMSITLGISIGMSSVLARAIGSGTDEPAHVIATGGMILAGIMMLIVSVIGIACLEPLLVALGTNQETRPLASDYLLWWFCKPLFHGAPQRRSQRIKSYRRRQSLQRYYGIGQRVADRISAPFRIRLAWAT